MKNESGQTWRDHAPSPLRNGRLHTITLTRPRCPHCQGIALKKYRSIRDQGDGSAMSWVRCACGERFKLLLE